jgi:hypothetical protein
MKKILCATLLLLCSQLSKAQDFRGYYTASFDFNQPLTNTHWINTMSVLGIKAGYHKMINEKFSIGGEVNWGTYKEYHPTQTFYSSGAATTTDYFNYIYSYGLVVSGR